MRRRRLSGVLPCCRTLRGSVRWVGGWRVWVAWFGWSQVVVTADSHPVLLCVYTNIGAL